MRAPAAKPPGGTPWWLILLVAVLLVPLAVAAPHKNTASDPRVSSAGVELLGTDLVTPLKRLSGLSPNNITAGYTAEGNEILTCTSPEPVIRFTVDGTNPSSVSPSVVFACQSEPPSPQTQNYRGVLNPSDLAAAPVDATVAFRLEIPYLSGTTQSTLTDNNGGAFYKYKLDRTRPDLLNRTPSVVAGSSVLDAVTNNPRTALSFQVKDERLEAPLDVTSFKVAIDATDRTSAFDCSRVDDWTRNCSLNYAKLPAGHAWTDGNHNLAISFKDQTGNFIDNAKANTKFVVDRTAPQVSNVMAMPSASIPPTQPGDVPTTGRSTNVSVTAEVRDPNLNTKGTNNVLAQLYNASLGIQSPLTPMKFVSGTKWEVKNLTAPSSWPEGRYRLHARVVALDQAGNAAQTNSTVEAFALDAAGPFIQETAPPAYIGDKAFNVRAVVTDNHTGVEKPKVKIRFANITGQFKAAPTGVTKVGGLFEAPMANPSGDNFTYDLPAAKGGAVLIYFITAADKAGTGANGPIRTLQVDATPPTIAEVDPRPFRSLGPYTFRAEVRDAAAGVDDGSVRLHYGLGTTFSNRTMQREGNSTIFKATADIPSTKDGDTIRYYFEARDKVGNAGNLSSAAAPLTSKIDLQPPSFTLSAPATTAGPTFNLSWSGNDPNGIESYTIQARVVSALGTSDWVTILDRVATTSYEVCALGGRSYEFRGYATDRAGNAGTLPVAAQKKSELSGAGCIETGAVTVLVPTSGAIIDAESAPGKILTVGYLASVTRGLTPFSALKIDVLFSPDNGNHYFPRGVNLANTGRFNLSLDLPSCHSCLLRVRAATLSGTVLEGTSGLFELRGGDPDVDLDGNGLPDEWELRFTAGLGLTDPDADPDDDRLTNAEEAALGSDPSSEDTDGDGVTDFAESRAGTDPANPASRPTDVERRVEQWTLFYFVVPVLFVLLGVVFFLGLARRW